MIMNQSYLLHITLTVTSKYITIHPLCSFYISITKLFKATLSVLNKYYCIFQIANLGPISYSLFRWLSNGRRGQSYAIYFLFFIGTFSSIFLALFWDRTTFLFGYERSTALFALVIYHAFKQSQKENRQLVGQLVDFIFLNVSGIL